MSKKYPNQVYKNTGQNLLIAYLHKNNSNCIVQHALAKDKGIEVDINIEVVEDGEDGDRVGGRDEGAKVEVVNEGDVLQVGDNTEVECIIKSH